MLFYFIQIPPADIPRLPSRTLRAINAAVVTSDSNAREAGQWWFSACSLAGSMSERVFIKVSADSDSGKVKVDVYSDNAMLPSKLAGSIKKAVEGKGR